MNRKAGRFKIKALLALCVSKFCNHIGMAWLIQWTPARQLFSFKFVDTLPDSGHMPEVNDSASYIVCAVGCRCNYRQHFSKLLLCLKRIAPSTWTRHTHRTIWKLRTFSSFPLNPERVRRITNGFNRRAIVIFCNVFSAPQTNIHRIAFY